MPKLSSVCFCGFFHEPMLILQLRSKIKVFVCRNPYAQQTIMRSPKVEGGCERHGGQGNRPGQGSRAIAQATPVTIASTQTTAPITSSVDGSLNSRFFSLTAALCLQQTTATMPLKIWLTTWQ